MTRPRLATVWLDGCSGCHMSFLDMDERLLEIGQRADLVYSPLVDTKDYPEGVDVCLVEGAVSSDEDLAKIKVIRARTRILVSFGDCAVTSNVPGMRNPIGPLPLLERAYLENATDNRQIPSQVVPRLLEAALPVHRVVKVDLFLPGCPPSADLIYFTVNELLEGRMPDTAHIARFGA
jgi:NAD-reducing hydrogenase small subunit